MSAAPHRATRTRAMLDARTTSFATLVLCVTYPGYLTYKTLEHDRKKVEAQRGWCIYWVVCGFWLSVIPVLDRAFDGRVGLYRECKVIMDASRARWDVGRVELGCAWALTDGRRATRAQLAFCAYLWHPRFQGALYVYDRFLAPFLLSHEARMDDVLARTFERVGDVGGRAFSNAYAYARRAANDALAKATEAQMTAESGAQAASGRADRIETIRRASNVAPRT